MGEEKVSGDATKRKGTFQLLQIGSLYLKAGYLQKASVYVARARNRAQERGEWEALAVQIETMQQQIQVSTTNR